MDVDDITTVVDNLYGPYEQAYELCRDALLADDDESLSGDSGSTHAQRAACADVIRTLINESAEAHGVNLTNGDSLLETLLIQTLGNVEWQKVGEYYFDTTRERYQHENAD